MLFPEELHRGWERQDHNLHHQYGHCQRHLWTVPEHEKNAPDTHGAIWGQRHVHEFGESKRTTPKIGTWSRRPSETSTGFCWWATVRGKDLF